MKCLITLVSLIILLNSCETLCDCYENDDPEVHLTCNDIYPGFWKARSDCSDAYNNTYTLTFNESEDCIETTLYNFLGDGEIILVEFKSKSIVIPIQEFDQYDDIFGTGFFNGDTLRIAFTLKNRSFGWEELCEIEAVKE